MSVERIDRDGGVRGARSILPRRGPEMIALQVFPDGPNGLLGDIGDVPIGNLPEQVRKLPWNANGVPRLVAVSCTRFFLHGRKSKHGWNPLQQENRWAIFP